MLPALYVLDSLIRHVGPPYSTYLGANLYRTFMEMYRQVGNAIRKDMEAVLRTWKEPPQGSRNPRPVLPVEITEPIENALAKFRSITMQSQQPRPLPGQPPFRNSPQPGMMYHNGVGVQGTPTPVDMAALMGQLQQRTGTPTYTNTNMNGLQRHPVVTSPAIRPAMLSHILPPSQTSTPLNFAPFQAPTATPPQAHQTVTQDQLKNEVNQLLQSANIQKILDASNNDLPQLVSTLESLKSLLDKQQFMAPDLLAMQSELSKISSRLNSQIASILGNAQGNTPPPIPPVSRMPMNPYQTVSTPPGMLPFAPPPISFPPSLPPQSRTISPPPQNVPVDMASLLGLLGPPPPIPQPAPTPVFPGLAPQSMSQHSSRNTNSQPPAGGGGLLDMLRASGLLMGAPTPQQSNINFPIPPPSAMISPPGGRRYGVRLDQESITKTSVYFILT
jgi:pre-mRNA cleavage complex 2 protein Pcf11